jgi:DNA invertase Pin-like site-specific DNA recombinase
VLETFNKNGINVKSLKEGFETLLDNGKVNPMANMVIAVMGSIAQQERDRIKERQAEGIAVAKVSGKYTGRKVGSTQSDSKLLERHPIIVKKLKKGGLSVRDIAELANCSPNTIMKVKKVLQKRGDL